MSSKTIGAFEAKTHFSQLLKEVEEGTVVHITRRGKAVAVIAPEGYEKELAALRSLDRISSRRKRISGREKLTTRDIRDPRSGAQVIMSGNAVIFDTSAAMALFLHDIQ